MRYAIYDNNTETSADQITLVADIAFPTGSAYKMLHTGFGAPSFFLGFTASHTNTDWYPFMSVGAVLPTSHKGTKFGNQFLYQCGLGKNIRYRPNKWILNWMIELDGMYSQRNRIAGTIDQDSGGNTLLLGPSLWFSTQKFIAQGGISWVIAQHLFGIQDKDRYFIAANFGWKF